MSSSWKCPHCRQWIGPMEVHEDCARKQEEKRDAPKPGVHVFVDGPASASTATTTKLGGLYFEED